MLAWCGIECITSLCIYIYPPYDITRKDKDKDKDKDTGYWILDRITDYRDAGDIHSYSCISITATSGRAGGWTDETSQQISTLLYHIDYLPLINY